MRNVKKLAITGIVVVLLSLTTTNISPVYADSQENHAQHQMQGNTGHEMHSNQDVTAPLEQHTAHAVIGTNPNVSNENHEDHSGSRAITEINRGPDWTVLYGFGGFNLAVIAAAAFLKYTRAYRKEVG